MGFDRLFASNNSEASSLTIVLLDGGLGTTLEDIFHKDIKHPLWSARLVDNDEKIIVDAHLAFLRAGSQVIQTSTYQAAYETFRRAGYTDSDGEELMWKSVKLAADACQRYELEFTSPTSTSSKSSDHPRPKIALSLGPYGATLETAAEFSGIYPPPYGPSLYQPLRRLVSVSEEAAYEDALAVFHYSRLMVYVRNEEVWNTVDIIAFETVPLVTEAKAIRRAVARLQDWFRETREEGSCLTQKAQEMKPWYISFVFPGPRGAFPQYVHNSNSREDHEDSSIAWRPYTPYEVAHAALSPQKSGFPEMATPEGIGINCTKVIDIPRVVDGFILATKNLQLEFQNLSRDGLPWLVLSPNGGLVYDSDGHTWKPNLDSEGRPVTSTVDWAQLVQDTLLAQYTDHLPQLAGMFGGVLLGGCCKTGPRDIEALKQVMSSRKH